VPLIGKYKENADFNQLGMVLMANGYLSAVTNTQSWNFADGASGNIF
jgi:hypothetical protein